MSKKFRYRQMTGCVDCDIELPNGGPGRCCPECGGTFMGHSIIHNYVLKEVWVPVRRRWWNPATWLGGQWKKDNKHE